MLLARAQTQTAHSEMEHTNPEVTAPPLFAPCFSKVLKRFRTQKAIAKSQTFSLQSCFIHISLIWTEVPFIQEVSGIYTSLFLDTE